MSRATTAPGEEFKHTSRGGEVGGKCRCSHSSSHKMPGTHKMPTLPPSGGQYGIFDGGFRGLDKRRQLEKRHMCGPKASAWERTRSWPSENGKGNWVCVMRTYGAHFKWNFRCDYASCRLSPCSPIFHRHSASHPLSSILDIMCPRYPVSLASAKQFRLHWSAACEQQVALLEDTPRVGCIFFLLPLVCFTYLPASFLSFCLL